MSQPVPDFGQRPTATAPTLIGLAQRTDLSARVRGMLQGVSSICAAVFNRAIESSLNDFEQSLFRLAEKARNNDIQNRCFESLREVKRGRTEVAPRFLRHLEDALANFDRGLEKIEVSTSENPRNRPPGTQTLSELSLVATTDLEESLALQEIAAKAEVRQSQALYALGHRFAVLAASPVIEAEVLAIGPTKLAQAARYAAAQLDLPMDQRVLLYRSFDRIAMVEIHALYEAINEYFAQHRILRHLRVGPQRLKPNASASAAGASAAPAEAAAVDPNAATRSVRGHDAPAPQPTEAYAGNAAPPSPRSAFHAQTPEAEFSSPTAASLAPPQLATGLPPVSRGVRPTVADSGQRGNPTIQSIPGAPTIAVEDDSPDSELFTILRGLLSDRRMLAGASGSVPGSALAAAQTTPANRAAASYVATPDDVQSVLSALQSRPAVPMLSGGKLVPRSIDHLKQDMLAQLRQFSPEGRPPQFAEEDTDTMDLVGMLFDHVGKLARTDGATQSLMTKLQVPVLRVALKDKTFFSRKNHPARQLLNTIAETGTHWVDHSDGETDHALVDKMRMMVDRVSSDFDGNLNLFEDMLGDLSQHMQTLTRKAEVAERRHVDAAKGREKLDLAREQASAAIANRVDKHKPTKLLRTVLEQGWIDVLALTLLRQGEQSDVYKRRLEVADQLIAADASGRSGDESWRGSDSEELRHEVEAGLGQVGLHQEDVQSVVKKLFTPEEAQSEENPTTQTEIALKLKNKARFGVDSGDAHQNRTLAGKFQGAPLNAAEEAMLARLRAVPFGTWFEFVTNQQGDRVRRKLSWFSPMTRRCLFVNQRGARTDETSMDQLARDLVRGQVHFVEPETESIIDRALSAIKSSLKHLVGRSDSDAGAALQAQAAPTA